eukprot:4360478-Prymnesium_polylepis.1
MVGQDCMCHSHRKRAPNTLPRPPAAAASCARTRARMAHAGTQWGHGCMGLGSRLMSSLAHFGLPHH